MRNALTGGPRVVVTLSSIPSRLPALERTLRSLAEQTLRPHAIYLWLCRRYERTGQTLQPRDVPATIRDSPNVRLRWTADRGPFTKLRDTLVREQKSGTIIVVVDDDRIYPPSLIEQLLRALAAIGPAAVGFRGRRFVPTDPGQTGAPDYNRSILFQDGPTGGAIEVDVLTGTGAIAFSRGVIGPELLTAWEVACQECPGLFYVDDMWLNGWLQRWGIPRYVIGGTVGTPTPSTSNDALWAINEGARNNDAAMAWFGDWSPVANAHRDREPPTPASVIG